MHAIALARAIENGPRTLRSNGKVLAAYCMTKRELRSLFVVENRYSPNRSAWLNNIKSWGDEDLWGDEIAKDFFEEGNMDANVIFMTMAPDDVTRLKMFAEKHDAIACYYRKCEEFTYDLSKLNRSASATPGVVE